MRTIDPELFFEQEAARQAEYWRQLKHRAAIAAMQAMLTSPELMQVVTSAKELLTNEYAKRVAVVAARYAHALVEEFRNAENPKELEGLKKELEALKIEKTILENKIKLLKEERK